MVLDGPPVLAEPDRQHLEEPGLDGALEVRVRLHAIDQADPVGAGRALLEPDGQAERLADLDDLHGRAARDTHRLLVDPVMVEHRELALRGAAAMAPHRGEDERPCAELFQVVDRRLDDRRIAGDAPAAGPDRHRVSALDRMAARGERGARRRRDVGDSRSGETLTNADHSGERHSGHIRRRHWQVKREMPVST